MQIQSAWWRNQVLKLAKVILSLNPLSFHSKPYGNRRLEQKAEERGALNAWELFGMKVGEQWISGSWLEERRELFILIVKPTVQIWVESSDTDHRNFWPFYKTLFKVQSKMVNTTRARTLSGMLELLAVKTSDFCWDSRCTAEPGG